MPFIHDDVMDLIAEALIKHPLQKRDVESATKRAIKKVMPKLVQALRKSLNQSAPRMLSKHRLLHAGFRARNFKRWCKALDILETQWVIAQEFVDEFDAKHSNGAKQLQDFQFEALNNIHARALLVTREIICLIEGGYADGALSRWRSLHELAVTAAFLSKQDARVAERYLASFHFESYRAAIQLNEHAARAKLRKFSDRELASILETRDHLEKQFGKGMRKNYGWAAEALGKDEPNFSDLEVSTGLDHWRPRYKRASQHTHGNHRPAASLLGLAESKQPNFLVGASNSGFVDPLQMTSISLNICTATLLSTKSSIDTITVLNILSDFTRRIGPLAIKIERESLRSAKERTKKLKMKTKAKLKNSSRKIKKQ